MWNARFDRHPSLIAVCETARDVAEAVRFGRSNHLEIAVRGGGHSYAGNTVTDGCLLIDCRRMSDVRVDPERRLATVGPGARWAAVDQATQAHGLATPGATVSYVGVAGFTLGGGSGWLSRKHGLGVDNLVAAEVVTADGEIVRASEQENADLLWALRGGGGNFGVVTSFELALHPVGPKVLAGQVLYPVDRAPDLLRFYREYFRDAPDEVMCFPFLIRVPPVPAFPEEFHGQIALDFVVAYAGPVQEAEEHLAPFRDRGGAFMDVVAPQPYVNLQQAFDAGMGDGNRWYSRSRQMDRLEDAAIDALLDNLEPFPGAFTAVYLGALGGAISRPAEQDIAYPHRSSAHELHILPGWTDAADDESIIAWADRLHEAMEPYGNGRVYVNLLGDGEEDRLPRAYASNYQRLRRLKQKGDPENVFHANHNLPPDS